MVTIDPIGGLDSLLYVISLGVGAGIISQYLYELWKMIPTLGSIRLLNMLVLILIAILIGWIVCFVVFGPAGSVIICIIVVIWAVVSAILLNLMRTMARE